MKYPGTIQKFIAACLLLIFSVSIAPKAFFHDLVANHKDISTCKQVHQGSVLHKQGLHCHFDDLVVSTPFVLQTTPAITSPLFHYDKQDHSFYISSFQELSLQKESRGPPSA